MSHGKGESMNQGHGSGAIRWSSEPPVHTRLWWGGNPVGPPICSELLIHSPAVPRPSSASKHWN